MQASFSMPGTMLYPTIHEKGELATDSFAGLLNEHKIGAIILQAILKNSGSAYWKVCKPHHPHPPCLLLQVWRQRHVWPFVHEAVVGIGETQSGMTIHLVNEKYDEGKILFQAICPVFPHDHADEVAKGCCPWSTNILPPSLGNGIFYRF